MTAESQGQLPVDQPSTNARLVFIDTQSRRVVELRDTALILGSDGILRAGYARILKEAGCYTLTPLLSASPVLINNRPVRWPESVTLSDGDSISFAGQTARFEQRVGVDDHTDARPVDELRTILRVTRRSAKGSLWRALLPAALVAGLALAGYAVQRSRTDTGSGGARLSGERSAVPSGSEAGAFDVAGSGSGRVAIPVVAPAFTVRVSISRDSPPPGTWFWCFGSDFGIPPNARFCSASGVLNSQTGRLSSERLISIDPSWPSAARYYVHLYCEHAECAWDVEVVSRPTP